MKQILRCCLLVWLINNAGCGSSVDDKALLDQQIEEEWLTKGELVDAIPFFENGGLYEDTALSGPIDQPTVLPLVRTLHDTLNLDVKVIQDSPGTATAILIPVPDDESTQERVREVLSDASREFSGIVMHNWSHHWISLDFLDEQEMKALADAGVLDKVLEHFEPAVQE